MVSRKFLNLVPTALAAASALLYLSSNAYSASQRTGPVLRAASHLVAPNSAMTSSAIGAAKPVAHNTNAEARTAHALDVLASGVRRLSHPDALRDAFQSYFAFDSEHPEQVKKPYLYFVDYGLSSSTPRGYVFDMSALRIVDGPFMVAQGRGSATNASGIPKRFSNAFGAATTSLGLYVAQ
ncbi:MAG TPA: murein L,D-transpeptidase catalytic domain family protein, partial [Gemmatimonadaceae bacterium]